MIRPSTVVARAVERPPKMTELDPALDPEWSSAKVTRIPHTVPKRPKNGARVTIVERIKRCFSRVLYWAEIVVDTCCSKMSISLVVR